MKSLSQKQTGIILLTLIFVSLVGVICLKVISDPNRYTSHDSIHYLNEVDYILDHGISSLFNKQAENFQPFTTWPIGYPIAVSVVSIITRTSPLIASKLLNFIALGLIFILLFQWFGNSAWLPALYFFSYSCVEIFTHSWSDGPFLYCVLLLAYIITQGEKNNKDKCLFLKLIGLLITLFLLRYAGIMYFFILTGIMAYYMLQRNYVKARHYFTALSIASLFVCSYFFHNKLVSGYYFGIDRADIPVYSFIEILREIGYGILNEISIARNIYAGNPFDALYFVLILLQTFILIKVLKPYKLRVIKYYNKPKVNLVVISGIAYLVILILFRFTSIISEFNYRILAPSTTLLFIALLVIYADDEQHLSLKKGTKWIIGFMVLSLLMNLPKWYLINLVS